MQSKLGRLSGMALALVAGASCAIAKPTSPWEKEIVYQIFPRSYFDTNGDHVGDLRGITEKLPFLHQFGVTAILINPIFDAREYHNYFADDFFRVDPSLGTNDDFFRLNRTAHRMQMKVLLDMEVQYVADRHPWFAAVRRNPKSRFRHYLWTKGSALYGLQLKWVGYGKVDICAVNPNNPSVRRYMARVFRFWTAPGGNRDDGVDGFRIDHMMDDLDNKHVKTGMLRRFWRPIERSVRALKHDAFFLAEQADWKTGRDLFKKADVDAVFNFPLQQAFVKLDKNRIASAIVATDKNTPPAKTQFDFIENHDMERFASIAKGNEALERLGAVFNLTVCGTPIIYYGQELGMRGIQGKWGSDGNDIPVRLAYRWTSKVNGPGSANFYRGSGPWARTGFERDDDGISLEEELPNANSLFNFYRRLIALRKSKPALSVGSIRVVPTDVPELLCYERVTANQSVRVYLNLSDKVVRDHQPLEHGWQLILSTYPPSSTSDADIPPYGFLICDREQGENPSSEASGLPSMADRDASPAALRLYRRLVSAYGFKTFSGQYGEHDSRYVEQVTRRRPAIYGDDLMDYSPSRVAHNPANLHDTENAIRMGRAGQIVTLSWHWNAPTGLIDKVLKDKNGKDLDARWYKGFYTYATTFDLDHALANPSSANYKLILRDIDAIAVQLRKLSNAGITVLWRPLHEAEGGWFWWGAKGPQPFIKLWRLLFDRLTAVHHLHNLIWVFTAGSNPMWYPGDAYVDIIGVDAYPKDRSDPLVGDWQNLRQRFGNRKPLAITEFGGVPDVTKMQKMGVMWDYFVSWSGSVNPTDTSPTFLRQVYGDSGVVNSPVATRARHAKGR